MTLLGGELARRLSERWLSLLVLPGLVFAVVAAIAVTLGQRRWADTDLLVERAAGVADVPDDRARVAVVLALAAVCASTLAAGFAAQAAGRFVELLWLGRWPAPLGPLRGTLTRRRTRRWEQADAALQRAHAARTSPEVRDALAGRRNAIGLGRPAMPTWIGDRLALVDRRIHAEYGLDLAFAWPRMWLILPEHVRGELRSTSAEFGESAVLAGWGLLYLLLGVVWWPAAPGGLVVLAEARRRGRVAAANLGDLAEAAVDLHVLALARALGLDEGAATFTVPVGRRVAERLAKGS